MNHYDTPPFNEWEKQERLAEEQAQKEYEFTLVMEANQELFKSIGASPEDIEAVLGELNISGRCEIVTTPEGHFEEDLDCFFGLLFMTSTHLFAEITTDKYLKIPYTI